MTNRIYGIGIDIGTTNIAAAAVDPEGRILREAACGNSGACYGLDVMSRIGVAAAGKAGELRDLMQEDIAGLITELLGRGGREVSDGGLQAVAIAGNTAMLHILNGYETAGLGKYPYTPVSVDCEEKRLGEVLETKLSEDLREIPVFILPGISAFVGADIVSGLYATEILRRPAEETILFLDLGTNGEMALKRGRDLTVCSTAAGPVFEGAGIRCGMRGESGAISDVLLVPSVKGGIADAGVEARCRTIGGKPPRGICGSGVLKAVSETVRMKLTDQEGLFREPWFSQGLLLAAGADGGEIRLYQEDIRAVQLAKAAIRAGAETLPLSCGITAGDIDEVLVAGNFGSALELSGIAPLGLLPAALLSRCRSAGNTALAGAVKLLVQTAGGRREEALSELSEITDHAAQLSLAGRQDFEACYLAMMRMGR